MRSPALRPWLVLLLAVVFLGGCSAVHDAADTASKTSDCAKIVSKVANINLSPDAVAADVKQAVAELDQTIEGLDNQDVKNAARALSDDIKSFQQTLSKADADDVNRALTTVTNSAENLARTCNVPIDQLTGK
jgi:hypothetical protein